MDEHAVRPLKVGLVVPINERVRWADMLAMARRAEEVGFDSLWVYDHFLYRTPGQPVRGVWECWSVLAALAASTTRVELGPLVSCTGYRNPALLAKMADTVDEISGGRLVLGLGAGWNEPEYRAFGFPFDHRYSRFEEALTIIHGLLREGRVDFAGKYHQARECELRPRGPRPKGPPLLIGTMGERMLRLTARYGDRWNTGHHPVADLPAVHAAVDAACAEVGRDPATLERSLELLVDLPGGPSRARRERPGPLAGTPDELAAESRAYAEAGIHHLQLSLSPPTVAGVEALAPVLERLG
jgi:probable F420-dependent oxidoreductase